MPVSPPQTPPSVDRYIDEQIQRTRRTVRIIDLAAALMKLALAVVVFFLTAALIEHWLVGRGGFSGWARLGLFATALGGAGWFAWRAIWPILSRPINPIYAADVIEKHAPSLKNSLVNLLFFRGARERYAPAVYETLERQTAAGLGRAHVETAVDRGHVVRLGYALLGAVVLAGLYTVLSPKSALTTLARVMAPWAQIAAPSRVRIDRLEPGSVEVTQGETLTVAADITGLGADESPYLVYSTSDGQVVDRRTPMRAGASGLRFAIPLPPPGESGALLGLQNDLTYRIEAGDAQTVAQRVRVVRSPAIAIREVHYDYPDYTGYLDRTEPGAGDLAAIEGTKVTIYADANVPIERASIDFEADGLSDLTLESDGESAVGSFVLRLRSDRRAPEHNSYALRVIDREGRKNDRPARRRIDVTPDMPPEVELLAPAAAEIEVRLNQATEMEVSARDPDFALSDLRLIAERSGDAATSGGVFDVSLIDAPRSEAVKSKHRFTPTDYGLRAGDVVECWAVARDNRLPEANEAISRRLRIKVVDPGPRQPGEGEPQVANKDQPQKGEEEPNDAGAEGGDLGQGEPRPAGGGNEPQQEGEQPGEPGGEPQPNQGGAGDQQAQPQPSREESQQQQGNDQGEQQQGGEAGGMQKGGEKNDGTSGGPGGHQGEPDPSNDGDQQGDPSDGGGARGEPSGEQRPVSAEGDDDATAFQKIQNRLNEQQKKEAQGSGKPGEPNAGGDPSQGEPNGNQAPGAEAKERTERAEPGAKASGNEQQVDAGKQTGGSQPKPGADGDSSAEGPGAQTPPEPPDGAKPTQPQEGDQNPSNSAGGEQLSPKGEAGAGAEGDPQGAPNADSRMRPRDKPGGQGAERQETDSTEPPAPGNGQKESDSEGGEGGDRPGGGEEGGGQQANREGTGSAGQNQAADEGSGRAADRGPGEASQNAGGDQASDQSTGSDAKTTQEGGQSQAGGEEPGGGQQPSQGKPAESEPPAEPSRDESDTAEGDTAEGDNPGEQGRESQGAPSQQQREQQPGEQQPNDPSKPQPKSQPEDANENAAGAQPGGNADRGGADGAPPPAVDSVGDEANLEYARKQTDLVLETLEDQLRKNKIDQKLLDELGWSEADLRRFVERWQARRQAAAKPGADTAKQRLDDALKSLGLKPPALSGSTQAAEDQMRDLNEAYRGPVPAAFRDRVRVYNQGVSKAP